MIYPFSGYAKVLGDLANEGLDIVREQASKIMNGQAYVDDKQIVATAQETALINVLMNYREALAQLDLIEVSQMPAELFADDNFVKNLSDFEFVFVCFDGFKLYEKQLIAQLSERANDLFILAESKEAVKAPANTPKFIIPTGPQALPRSVVQAVKKHINASDDCTAIVAASDPYPIF